MSENYHINFHWIISIDFGAVSFIKTITTSRYLLFLVEKSFEKLATC